MKNLLLLLGILFAFFQSVAQNSFPNDWDLEPQEGKPRVIEETSIVTAQDVIFKKIYHFNEKGYLVKIEDYSDYHVEKDSLMLSNYVYYSYPTDSTRISTTVSPLQQDTLSVTNYQFIATNLISLATNNFNSPHKVKVLQTLDTLMRIKSTNAVVTKKKTKEIVTASTTRFFYQQNRLHKLNVLNERTLPEGNNILVENVQLDRLGNVLHRIYRDAKTGEVTYEVKRNYIYF